MVRRHKVGASTASRFIAFCGTPFFLGGGEFSSRQDLLKVPRLFLAVNQSILLADLFHFRTLEVVEEEFGVGEGVRVIWIVRRYKRDDFFVLCFLGSMHVLGFLNASFNEVPGVILISESVS